MAAINMQSTIKNRFKYYLIKQYGRRQDKKKAVLDASKLRSSGRKAFVKSEFGWHKVYATRLKSDKVRQGKLFFNY